MALPRPAPMVGCAPTGERGRSAPWEGRALGRHLRVRSRTTCGGRRAEPASEPGTVRRPSTDAESAESDKVALLPAAGWRDLSPSVHRPYVCAILAWECVPSMPRAAASRDDRIELRASREEKRLLVAAAAYQRLDLTTFVLRTALPAAEEVVARHERLRVSARDGARVLELLENPPKPTSALEAAARLLRRTRA